MARSREGIERFIQKRQRATSDNRWSGNEDWARDDFGQTILAQRICALYVKKYGVNWDPREKRDVVGRREYEKNIALLLARPDWPALLREACDNII